MTAETQRARGRLARWVVDIQDYTFKVLYAPGDNLVVADTLSRDAVTAQHCPYCDENVAAVLEEFDLPSMEDIKTEQQEELTENDQNLEKREDCVTEDNGVRKKLHFGKPKIIVPKSLTNAILKYDHGFKIHGHTGVGKTSVRLIQNVRWKNCKSDVRKWVVKCPRCAVERMNLPGRQGLMRFWNPSRRFECIAVDVMEVSPASKNGYKKIVVIGDLFTRYFWAAPIKNETAPTLARVILDEWGLRFRPPERLLADRVKAFMSGVIQEMCLLLGVKKVFTSPYHPQTDGFVDRFNRTLMADMRAFVG